MNNAYEPSNGNKTLVHTNTGNHFNHIWAHTVTIHEQEADDVIEQLRGILFESYGGVNRALLIK